MKQFKVTWLLVAGGIFVSLGGALAGEDGRMLPVPNITIYPGDRIRDGWIVDRDFTGNPAASRGGVIDSHEALVGKVAKRTLLPGLPVAATSVGEPRLVTNGEKVKVVFTEGGLTITTYGAALQAGGAGDVVSVRNLDSGLTISGVVAPDGSIHLNGG
jgi:flagella basal body P-ring formation protein FlgA